MRSTATSTNERGMCIAVQSETDYGVLVRTLSCGSLALAIFITYADAQQAFANRQTAPPGRFAEAEKAASELPRLHSLLVSWRRDVVLERYFNGARAVRAANVKSVSKSIISALVGVAIDRGMVPGTDTPIRTYFPEIGKDRDERKQRMADLGRHLMHAVGRVVPVVPVPLIDTVFTANPGSALSEIELVERSVSPRIFSSTCAARAVSPTPSDTRSAPTVIWSAARPTPFCTF